MGDMKDKFKGFMKKVNNQLSTSSSGKFKGQGRVLGSASGSGPINPNNPRQNVNPPRNTNQNSANLAQKLPSEPIVNPSRNVNQNLANSLSNSVNLAQKLPSEPIVSKPVLDGEVGSSRKSPNVDGFDPYGSLITTGKRNKNGFELSNVFECPVCNRGFGSEDEVSLHIETCIGEVSEGVAELETENEVRVESVGACVGVYLSGNPSEGSVDVVLRLFGNIVKDPENQKFRRVRISNPKIREAIGDVAGGIELLEFVGFELKEEEGEMWAVMDAPSEDGVLVIKETVKLLEQGKRVGESEVEKVVKKSEPEIIDREIKVFFSVPESVASRIELPDSFYKLSLEEVKREAEMKKKRMADSQLLIPKSLKEKQAQAARRKYRRAIIRVQFPDGVVLQGVFSPREPTSALYGFVSSALKQQGLEFELVHPIPVKRRVIPCFPKPGEKASTLEDEDLVPSALVKFKPFETDSMVFTGLTNELLEISEPLGS